MKIRFWIGICLLAIAAGLFAYRGQITAFVAERVIRRALPEAVSFSSFESRGTASSPASEHARSSPEAVQGDSQSSLVLGPQEPLKEEARPISGPAGFLGRTPDSPTSIELPAEFNLAVPFTSQAPFTVWDEMHNEACEEAAIMMVNAFYNGRTFTPQKAEDELQDIVVWENSTFGYFKDTTAEETAQILRKKYGYENVRVIYEPTLNDIKREVARGRPVIIPAAGQLLGNRYFRQPGPLYHMLVVRGWTKDGMIITNDPGTKRGEGYLYKPDILMNAVHDWNGGDVLNGRKVMIVVDNK